MDVEIEWSLGGGFAYASGEVIVHGQPALDFVQSLSGYDSFDGQSLGDSFRFRGIPDPLNVIAAARAAGINAQPNHVFVAHSCGCCGGDSCCGQSPCNADLATLLSPNPFRANPFRANPFRANPFRANPLCGNPFRANPFRANAGPRNSARVAPDPGQHDPKSLVDPPQVVVLDTGLVVEPTHPLLSNDALISGDDEHPPGANEELGAVAGHGTFIAGLVEWYAPGCEISAPQVVQSNGAVLESDVATALDAAILEGADIINMSFGGPIWAPASLLDIRLAAARQMGIVVVASAGNDGLCTPNYPAAFDSVVAVGALGPDGPASFTNYGSWVQACAPGVDLVSTFFPEFNGPATGDPDPDNFEGWAMWSGTSFAAPMVVAALANHMVDTGDSAVEAVAALIDDVAVQRIPCLGAIVGLEGAYPPEDEPTT